MKSHTIMKPTAFVTDKPVECPDGSAMPDRKPETPSPKPEARLSVSVVMCTYNGGKYLREQLDSIVRQTYPVLELLIQDDGSTDDTLYICQTYAARYGFIHVYRNESPRGVNRNFISCIRRAKGDYIAISDQDDIWEADKLARQMSVIGDKMLVSCFSKPFTSDHRVRIQFDQRLPNIAPERLIHASSLHGHTLIFRQDFLSKIPELDHWLQYFMYDHLFRLVAACYHSIAFCPEVLVHQRRHFEAVTYLPAPDYRYNLKNFMGSIRRTWRLYRNSRPEMKQYFGRIYQLLSVLPPDARYTENARKIAYWQTKSSFWAYLRLTALYVKCRHKITYSDEMPKFMALIRAFLFPITCSDYFRHSSDRIKVR